MKRQDKLEAMACLEEIASVVAIAKKPMLRKAYLMARKWHRFQKGRLIGLGYKGKILRLPGHTLKVEAE